MTETIPQIDETRLNDFGTRLFRMFETHETDRKAVEDRWLQNLRQFRGIYDPEVLGMIPKGASKAYPKLTRWKVIGTVARLMQMLFPQTEKNWGIRPSPLPDLSTEQLQIVLDELVARKAEGQGVPPEQVVCTDEEIEKAIHDKAVLKAARMELKLEDDLQELDYPTLARRVVFSAVLYNVGVLKGPLWVKKKARTWQRNQFTGRYSAVEIEKLKPTFEFLPVWNYYPDMTATTLDKQDGTFEMHIMTRAQVEELAKRPDFLGDRITEWLRTHKDGNHKPRHWETAMRGEPKSDRMNTQSTDTRKYEVLSYWGGVTGHDLRAAGVTVADEDIGKTFHANAWQIDNVVIKAKIAPFGDEARHHHEFVFEEDDLSLLGNGQCDTLRDSQLSICEVTRAALDNMSIIGPQLELNKDLLTPGQSYDITKNKAWIREGDGVSSQYPAVRNITIDSHLGELTALMDRFLDFADKESGLPPPSLGDVSGGGSEALRTQQNASMFLGAAALPIRDTVRNFDTFTKSVITSLVKWNMKYDPNESRDGDHDVIARGSTSLIAKEVLAQSLDMFRTTLSEDELPHVNHRALLEERARARDIPIDKILESKEKAEEVIQGLRAAQQQAGQLQNEMMREQIQEVMTKALKNAAEARKADSSVTVDVFNALLEGLASGNEQGSNARGGSRGAPAAK